MRPCCLGIRNQDTIQFKLIFGCFVGDVHYLKLLEGAPLPDMLMGDAPVLSEEMMP